MKLFRWSHFGAVAIASVSTQLPAVAANLVQNGNFEQSTSINTGTYGENGGIGQIDVAVNLPNWLKTCLLNCPGLPPSPSLDSKGFAFVVDANAATRPGGGFKSVFYPGETTYFWGPQNTVSTSNNGFTGSSDGGKFVAIDGDFGRSKLSQNVSGLDTSKTYTLSFEYAGAQQGLNATDFSGDTTQKWIVDGIGTSSIEVGSWTNPSKGFTAWNTYSTTFTPSSTSINLSFTPWGNVVGGGEPTGVNSLPPFLLLDNVQILESTGPGPGPGPGPGTSVPGPLPLLGFGAAFTMTRRLRRRLKPSS
jgi:hypothetical protein